VAIASVLAVATLAACSAGRSKAQASRPGTPAAATALASWNDGPAKAAIVAFVERVTKPTSPDFIAPADRIAVLDNDGTLWAEQPIYFQLAFALDRIKAMAPAHPEWKGKEPFRSVLADDPKGLAATGMKGIVEILAATHAGMTTDEFARIAHDWLTTARHPKRDRLYTDLVYQPMLEVLRYLRENGFKTFIVSGGGVEFLRVFAEKAYGIPPEQVVGSSGQTQFEMRNGVPVLVKLPKVEFIDDGPGKPVGINRVIGRRPVMAFGNSDGDLQMLQYTTGAPGARFALIVHHTDGEREFAYDRTSHIGKLDQALDEAATRGWTVVDMKRDWKTVFPER
jgi:phosphoglycolate phosphatase-like HAD superfamily hydrolase